MTQDEAKALAAQRAIALLPESGLIGLGSGSTARIFIDEVAKLVREGRRLTGVPTSNASRAQADRLGIPLADDDGPWDIAVCVDGADEVSRGALDLIKGGGGAHAREKIVNYSARVNLIIVDESKLSDRLGESWPIPVEVLGFGHKATVRALERFGEVKLRLKNDAAWLTDAGNFIYDVLAGPLENPGETDRALSAIPGVAATGLFVGRADRVIVAGQAGVIELTPAH